MKQLVILSGKGGTGKTTVAASFIALAGNKAFADCDVDAPNLHLVHALNARPQIEDFCGYRKAVKYDELCAACGKCEELCRFGAIKNGKVNPYECEGCGVCEAFCPSTGEDGMKAIRLENNISGNTMVYRSGNEVFSSAELKMGNGASGKLVTQVRKNLYNSMNGRDNRPAAENCRACNPELVIIDGSPGIGCPVIASITGVDMVLVVTEPTLSGMHDMERIVDTAGKFGTACTVCVNKFDVNPANTQKIEEYCSERNIAVVGKIPFDPKVVEAVNMGKPAALIENSPAKDAIFDVWQAVSKMLFMNRKEIE